MVDLPQDFVLFAMPYEKKEDIEYAKQYCKEHGHTPETAKIVITGEENDKYLLVKKR